MVRIKGPLTPRHVEKLVKGVIWYEKKVGENIDVQASQFLQKNTLKTFNEKPTQNDRENFSMKKKTTSPLNLTVRTHEKTHTLSGQTPDYARNEYLANHRTVFGI